MVIADLVAQPQAPPTAAGAPAFSDRMRRKITYLWVSLAVGLPLLLGLLIAPAADLVPPLVEDLVPPAVARAAIFAFFALMASILSVTCLVLAARSWPHTGGPEGRVFKIAAWLLPKIREFRRILLADARLEAEFTNVLVAYRFGAVEDVKSWVSDAGERACEGRGPEPLSTEELADRLASDLLSLAHRAADELPEPLLKALVACGHPLLARNLVMLHADRYGPAGKCYWGEDKARSIPLLACLAMRHEIFSGTGENYGADEIATALDRLSGFSLQRVVDDLRQAPRLVVNNMENVVGAYGLGSLDPGQRQDVLWSLPRSTWEADVVGKCAQQFAKHLRGEPKDVDRKARLMELLYRDRFGRPTWALWSTHQEELIDDLTSDISGKGPLAHRLVFREQDDPAAEPFVKELFERMDDFDMSLAVDVGTRVDKLRQLADRYAEYLKSSGMDADARITDVLDRVKPRLPENRSDRDFEAPDLEVDLLVELGEKWIGEQRALDLEAHMPVAEDSDDVAALAHVLAGSYLTRASRQLGLASDLAFRAGGVEHKDRVAKILLALMWRHQHSSQGRSVSLQELVRCWDEWIWDAEQKEGCFSSEALKHIRAELRRGVWPTKIPIEPAVTGLAGRLELVIEMLHKAKHGGLTQADKARLKESNLLGRAGDVQRALEAAFEEAQAEMRQVQKHWGDQMEERFRALVDRIQAARGPDDSALESSLLEIQLESSLLDIQKALDASAEPIARLSERVSELSDSHAGLADKLSELARTDQDLAGDIGTLTLSDHELSERVSELSDSSAGLVDKVSELATAAQDLAGDIGTLTLSDHELVAEISTLRATDQELAREVGRLLDQDVHHSPWYVITFDSKSAPMADDIDDLKRQPHHGYQYKFEHYTPFARIGRRAPGISFEDFCRRFLHDLHEANPHLDQNEVTVQLTARPRGTNIPEPGPDVWA